MLIAVPLGGTDLLVSPASAQRGRSGSIRGRVELRAPAGVAALRPNITDPAVAAKRLAVTRSQAVVYLDPAPRGAFEQSEPGRARLDQRNETFVPHVLAITAGTTVDFPNSDRIYHNVFSLSKAARFDLGRYATGRSKSVRFDRPGIVRVFCEIHSHMNAFILVFSHRFFAVSDGDGRYQIDAVPPGTYTLVAWVEGVIRDAKSITITPETRSVEADFPAR